MNIVILGAGRVGGEIAKMLVGECDVTLVDVHRARLLEMQSGYDLRTVAGSASDPEVLRRAGCAEADVIVAVTAIDEVNLVACKLCNALSAPGASAKIARIRGRAATEKSILGPDGFGIDHVFCPEQIVADDVIAAVRQPGCDSVLSFADGRAKLVSLKIRADAPLAGMTLRDARKQDPQLEYRVVAVLRGGKIIQPLAATRLTVGDEVFIVAAELDAGAVAAAVTGEARANRHVFLAGGGNIGARVAAALEKECDVKIVEVNRDRCRELSQILEKTMVLKGRATEEKLLQEEGVGEADIFCALTNDDEENILSAMLAKRLGARRVTALVNREAYVDILESLIDSAISPSQLTIGAVLPHVRRRDVSAVHSFRRGAEALEAVVHGDRDTSAVVDRRVDQIQWPKGVTLGAVARGDEFLVARHDMTIRDADRLILFADGRHAIHGVEKLLKVGLSYF